MSKDVIMLLGEPSDKYGGGRFRPVGISYETLGLDIQFKESSWEDEKNPMSFISVFQRLDPSHGLCEPLGGQMGGLLQWPRRCGKRALFRCGLCKQSRYCSSDCQKQDWPEHQKAQLLGLLHRLRGVPRTCEVHGRVLASLPASLAEDSRGGG